MTMVLCVATHPVDLDDGSVLGPGEWADDVDLTKGNNQVLLDEGHLIEISSPPKDSPRPDSPEPAPLSAVAAPAPAASAPPQEAALAPPPPAGSASGGSA